VPSRRSAGRPGSLVRETTTAAAASPGMKPSLCALVSSRRRRSKDRSVAPDRNESHPATMTQGAP
jgi:hypothetical protein